MWRRLQKVYKLTVKRERVRILLRSIDPEGVEGRRRYKLKRRIYDSPGPNFLWHADNHDKLKRLGFPIYGCIDGYSRKIIWIEVSSTNNNPSIIGSYYLKAIEKYGFVPTIMRTDNGTEANLMEDFQIAIRYYHEDEYSGFKSFIRGKSTRNQRIESYWRQFRQKLGDFFIDLFKTMEAENLFNASDPVQVDCLRYCFGDLLKEDILLTKKEWNEHRVRKQRNKNVMGGIPNVLYKCPEKFGAVDHRKNVNLEYIQYLKDTYTLEPILVSPVFKNLADQLLNQPSRPSNIDDAYNTYIKLTDAIKQLENETC